MIRVRMKPGHSTDTLIPRGASVTRSASERATTPYLVALYAGPDPAISPAMEAVETICPPSPCASIRGPKIAIPQTTDIRFTPKHSLQSDDELSAIEVILSIKFIDVRSTIAKISNQKRQGVLEPAVAKKPVRARPIARDPKESDRSALVVRLFWL
jgi:hypothetical protein